MNIGVILFLLSKIAYGIGAAQLVPLLIALYYGEVAYKVILFSIVCAGAMGFGLQFYGRPAQKEEISVREGIGTVFFSWFLAALLAGLPYYFAGVLDPVGAFFESMSGLTTTGATAISDLDVVPRSILFWRVLTHWIGGIGIIVLFVALLPQIAGGAVYLFNAEVTGFSNSRILPRIRTTAIALFYIYLLMTIILTGILRIMDMSLYDAVYHAFSAIATGGFSSYNSSVANFHSPMIEYALSFFMLMAAGNFAMYYRMTQFGFKVLWEDLEFKSFISMVLVITSLITMNIMCVNGYSFSEGFRAALFQVASFASTTGFVSADYDQWPSFAKLLLALMFFTGGCAGSTAGGIKICRLVVLLKTIMAELRRALHPQMLLTVQYEKNRLPVQTIINISRFFFVYILIVAITSLCLTSGGLPVEEAIFSAASCLASVGPAFDSLGATGTYADVAPIGKVALAMAMLLGRLELFTALALLRSEYWRDTKRW